MENRENRIDGISRLIAMVSNKRFDTVDKMLKEMGITSKRKFEREVCQYERIEDGLSVT